MIITTEKGKIEGIEKENCFLYKGIPYAKAPTGERRLKVPEELDAWDGIYEADHFPNISVQRGQKSGDFYYKEFFDDPEFITEMNEDCLYLNIWTPKEKGKYPVAVYIHGGGFFNGYSFEKEMDGEAYCKRGVILVTINYRLGLLGFFAEKSLGYGSGNFGLLDQICAINWVNDNISAFGGDKDNITIFGQSAGGRSVEILSTLPCMKGKFQRAIMQSSGGYIDNDLGNMTRQEKEKYIASYMKLHFLNMDRMMKMDPAKFVKMNYRLNAYITMRTRKGHVAGSPCIDKEIFPYDTNYAVDKGLLNDVDIMIGGTKNDIFVSKQGSRSLETNEMMKGVLTYADKVSAHRKCYVYYFEHDLPGDDSGAFHSGELWYMFGTLDRCYRPFDEEDYKLSEKMLDAWTGFMKNGDPGYPEYKEGRYVERYR